MLALFPKPYGPISGFILAQDKMAWVPLAIRVGGAVGNVTLSDCFFTILSRRTPQEDAKRTGKLETDKNIEKTR
jgi:hypothetical protein